MPPVTASDFTDSSSAADNPVSANSVTANSIPTENLDMNSKEGLQATFELFNRMSDDLSDSYRALEGRVSALTDELDRVNLQREQEVRSKEQITSRLSNLLDLLPGGVVVLDRWGTVSQINPAGEELSLIHI